MHLSDIGEFPWISISLFLNIWGLILLWSIADAMDLHTGKGEPGKGWEFRNYLSADFPDISIW